MKFKILRLVCLILTFQCPISSLLLSPSQPHSPHMHPPIRKMTFRFRGICVLPGVQASTPAASLIGPLSLFSSSYPITSHKFIVSFRPQIHHGFGKESFLLLSRLSEPQPVEYFSLVILEQPKHPSSQHSHFGLGFPVYLSIYIPHL